MLTSSAKAREHLVRALRLDLIGANPTDDDHYQTEILSQAPSKWYLTGFLVPYEASVEDRSTPDGNDQLSLLESSSASDEENTPEMASARKGLFPSSIGLSFLVTPQTQSVEVEITWGDYRSIEEAPDLAETALQERTSTPWQRTPQCRRLTVPLSNQLAPTTIALPDSNGLELSVSVRPVTGTDKLPTGTRAVSLFLVNHRRPETDSKRDAAYIFQAQLTVQTPNGFVPRPDLRTHRIEDDDERIADLQYRQDYEFAVGHNVSVIANPTLPCTEVKTAWMPTAEVEKVIANEAIPVELSMEAIAQANSADAVRAQISPMVQAYADWIATQPIPDPTNAADQRPITARDLLHRATIVNQRIAAGLAALDDPQVLEAFQLANRAIATAIRRRLTHGSDRQPEDIKPPKWRPFQLAFVLMNLVGIAQPGSRDREIVDLLFFPTGGGKTEAYLGLAAFTLVLRRLRNPGIQGAGMSVLMRYTLRLLTLDQLGRATTLICALELERQKDPVKLGVHPFEIGLWVGLGATPNEMGRKGDKKEGTARHRTREFKEGKTTTAPIPIDKCPWCGHALKKESFRLKPSEDSPLDLEVACLNRRCDFRGDNKLPIIAVDEAIYRRIPCFIISTVDKFANLPWVGRTASLFGKVTSYDNTGFYGAATPQQKGTQKLEKPLPPPDLIIQDELHLISGPLGTMVGLYETVIENLCSQEVNGKTIKPKIVASTATVRRATKQIRALFGRELVEVFPPPGPDRRDSFFAKTVSATESNARLYVGIAGQGRSLKVVLLRSYLALLGAAQKLWEESGGAKNKSNPVDPYMTLLGYFNSLRELGGSRRIVEDEVKSRLATYSTQKRITEPEGLFVDRTITDEPIELTSRVSTSQVAESKGQLEINFHSKERAVDVVLATNMISVGLDITRLGLMVVLGQPKTTAEYIQATSRVGRDENRPGLVITLMNIHRPRDRSHYERFQSWHNTFYRAVEATSVTPFSPRAIDRGLAGVSVGLARLGCDKLTAPLNALEILNHRNDLDFVAEALSRRAENHDKDRSSEEIEEQRIRLRSAVIDLLDSWSHLAEEKGKLQYQQEEGAAPPLLYDPLDPESRKQPKFRAQRSLRDVEQSVNLWIVNPDGAELEDES
ncbi:MAG: DISARM system helicase DrmA [Leptolyngbya sp. Prado105]|jgi:hypothetical protein|nr:DISARM system helicase DrmA [Leptolyngbya sp. Prado105]